MFTGKTSDFSSLGVRNDKDFIWKKKKKFSIAFSVKCLWQQETDYKFLWKRKDSITKLYKLLRQFKYKVLQWDLLKTDIDISRIYGSINQ